jgi:hypothetical protein
MVAFGIYMAGAGYILFFTDKVANLGARVNLFSMHDTHPHKAAQLSAEYFDYLGPRFQVSISQKKVHSNQRH